jgi:hypothetical protein
VRSRRWSAGSFIFRNSLRQETPFSFLTYYLGAWTVFGQLGRFIYKNVYFWGLPATIFLLVIAPMLVRGLSGCDRKFSRIIVLSMAIVLSFEALFLKIPVQRAYLLPMLPFALILLGFALQAHRRILLTTTMLIFSFNFVNLNLARPDVPDNATRASVGLFVEPGYLLTDLSARLAVTRTLVASLSHS